MIQKNDVLDDITTLYELSLSIGSSLNLYENCEHFLTTLLSRKNLDFASVWLKKSLIKPQQADGHNLMTVFALPVSKNGQEELSADHFLPVKTTQLPYFSYHVTDKEFTDCIQENNIVKGAYAIYQLGNIGFMKLYSARWQKALSTTELNKLKAVIDKFTVSLEGCLSHQRSIYEAKSRLKMEKQLHEKDMLYRTMVEKLQDGLIITTPESDIIFANPRMEELSGYKLSEMLHRKTYELFIAEDKQVLLNEKLQGRREGRSDKYEIEQVRKDGTCWQSLVNATPYYNDANEMIGIMALVTDITHQKNAEARLKKSEQDHRLLFNKNPHPMLIFATDNLQILAVNDTMVEKYGYTKEDFAQMSLRDLCWAEDIPCLEANLNQAKDVTRSRHCLKDGTLINVDISGRDILYNNQAARLVLIQDVTEKLKAENELQLTSSRLKALLQNMQAGILLEDAQRKVALANPVFCDMFDVPVPPEELKGLDCAPFAELSKGFFTNSDTFISVINDILTARNIVLGEELELVDGRVYERDYIPVFSNEEYLGHLWQYRDVSNKKKAQKVLIQARKKAEESSLAKERFLANMSHEIRTPLNAIIGMQRLLSKTSLEERQQRYLDAIGTSADNLLVIINDILDISKIEAGKLELENVGFDLCKLIRHLVFTLGYKAEEKGIGLYANIDDNMHPIVLGDSVRLHQILLNLLNNAIKFTDVGKVIISTSLVEANPDTQTVCFEVSDTGRGIKAENIEAVFESFTQEDASITRKFGGSGLGLAIGRQLVELFGGKLTVTSEYSKGTTFSFTLTFKKETLDAIAPVHEVTQEGEKILQGKKVLLAEDNQMNQFLATTILEEWGVIVEVAEDGKQAIEKFSENKYDLILMDMQMPIMDGLEATRIIRQQLRSTVPIIALTANAIKGDRQRCIEVGMNDYLPKPFAQKDLQEKILLNLNLPTKTLVQEPVVNKPNEELIQLYSLSKLDKMMSGNKTHIKKMLEMFVNDTPALVQDMQQALVSSDIQTVGKLAHKVKSSIDILDVKDLGKVVREIETLAKEYPQSERIPLLIRSFSSILKQVVIALQNDPMFQE
ncbi:PAS domain-containing hybrid sensor histidine kinase/response regulator [Microscilla marina]|uniref:Sensory/regulatory protein RpfC n=1 Tax=Microscilla marina ATCC 23134 TaxID=313606 RepID=A1ZSA0_MICM2|nr:PAS domain-containing hybrid sensor histidine kinase/response regulator [Microscilla marina]EAY26823.1 sensory box histidine kinase/response regulator [Microscilla marina ATCC 23134]